MTWLFRKRTVHPLSEVSAHLVLKYDPGDQDGSNQSPHRFLNISCRVGSRNNIPRESALVQWSAVTSPAVPAPPKQFPFGFIAVEFGDCIGRCKQGLGRFPSA